MRQFDIVAVRYPFSDNPEQYKLRPAIIISNEATNQLDNDVLCCPITTRMRQEPFSFLLENQFLVRPLPSKSEIRCHKIATIRKNLITKKVSRLQTSSQQKALLTLIMNALK